MSGLAERVREKIRGRSRSRSRSQRYSRDFDETVPEVPQIRNSQNYTNMTGPKVSSPTAPAWHVHSGNRNTRDTYDSPDTTQSMPGYMPGQFENFPPSQDYNQPPVAPSYRHQRNNPSEPLSANTSSLPRGQESHEQRPVDTQGGETLQYPYTVPRRKESLPQHRASKRMSVDRKRSPQQRQRNLEQDPHGYGDGADRAVHHTGIDDRGPSIDLPERHANGDLGTEIDQALASLHVSDSVVNGTDRQETHAVPANSQVHSNNEHVRLPEGFDLGNTVHTTIDTQWKPAVTHEHIHHQRTEIIQEAITRDIHVHHYYTYVQPIKVVEVLPARHYIIDENTGRKIEIEAPPGWVMPENLQPRNPDTAAIKGWTRHYLVNEQYPNGIAEPDPQTIARKPLNINPQHHRTSAEYRTY